jgi:hypothetical protein
MIHHLHRELNNKHNEGFVLVWKQTTRATFYINNGVVEQCVEGKTSNRLIVGFKIFPTEALILNISAQ